MFEMTKINE